MARTCSLLGLLPLLLALPACTEYYIDKKDSGPPVLVDTTDSVPLDTGNTGDTEAPDNCGTDEIPATECGINDTCVEPPVGGFVPIIEWEAGIGESCLSLPLVADLDLDGLPEVIVNFTGFLGTPGTLTVLAGDGSGIIWEDPDADLAYGSSPAVADLDHDGQPEIIAVRGRNPTPMVVTEYSVLCYSADGVLLWEAVTGSDGKNYDTLDFDWAAQPLISDMDHDGSPEIVVGRAILNADGTPRGEGQYGRGSYGVIDLGDMVITEASVPAVTDIDNDGIEEIIVGNAFYNADGEAIWADSSQNDAMIGIADLDLDGDGEIIGISYNTIRAMDTDGSVIWGPTEILTGNILAAPAIADLDGDGYVEIVTAGGNELVVFNHDGSVSWKSDVTDKSGATGASIFDFEGDGQPEVVYIDELEMIAFDGKTGVRKFYSTEHASKTMFDYPVVADVDADDHAEIVVCSEGTALTVFGDETNSWMPVRKLWNQHAYSIGNVNDDLSVPDYAEPSYLSTNTWHSAVSTTGDSIGIDVEPELLELCLKDCDEGKVWLTFKVWNISLVDLDAGLNVAIYAVSSGVPTLLSLYTTSEPVASGWTSKGVRVPISVERLAGAESIRLVLDDDGYGNGAFLECSESNNLIEVYGPFCE